jgi:4-amino-4-deoxy-L-arabinose transferase-like glycosyltransferase
MVAFVLFAILMRLFSFWITVIDHDESTYIVIADALRQGKVYWRDVIDTKPPGIFILFAIMQTVFGNSIMVIRLVTAITVGLTGWMLFLAHRKLDEGRAEDKYSSAAVASGLLYISAVSIFTYHGIAPNTEHFFNLVTSGALVLILLNRSPALYVLAGTLLGCAFLIKYVTAFDAFAFGLFLIISQWKSISSWMIKGIALVAGYAVPLTLAWLWYDRQGMTGDILFYLTELPGRYISDKSWKDYLLYTGEQFGRFLPLTIWFMYVMFNRSNVNQSIFIVGGLWATLVYVVCLLPGKLFPHYFIHMLLPLSFVAGSFFDPRLRLRSGWTWWRKPMVVKSMLGIIVVVTLTTQIIDYRPSKDTVKPVANWLNQRLQPGEHIYTGDYEQILYFLTGTSSPTPYIHSSLLWNDEHMSALKIDQHKTLNDIFDQKPRYVLMKNIRTYGPVILPMMEPNYELDTIFYSTVHIYVRREQ